MPTRKAARRGKLERLTPDQEALLPAVRDEWIAIGLDTRPSDRPAAERGVAEMYRRGGLEPPTRIVWCGSPLSMALTRAMVLDRAKGRDSVWDSVRDSVWDSVRDSVWDSVWDSVRDSVGDSVWDSVGASVGASVWASVWDSVGGQHDSNWLAHFDFFQRIGLTRQTEKLAGLWQLARAAGWALPHERICWVSERPNLLQLEAVPARGPFANQLHCEDGPALRYPDGWAIYSWHGVRVNEDVITCRPSSITTKRILGERNAEVARVLLERMGAERFATEADGAKVVHRDIDGNGNGSRLLSIPMPNMPDREARVVVVQCPSTDRQYVLGVPPWVATCQAAVAWTFGVDEPGKKDGELIMLKEQ